MQKLSCNKEYLVSQHYGGVGYNLALSAARNLPGEKTAFLTCVGNDNHADDLERNNEIDIELIRVNDAVTGQYTCIVNGSGKISLAIQVRFNRIIDKLTINYHKRAYLKRNATDQRLPSLKDHWKLEA